MARLHTALRAPTSSRGYLLAGLAEGVQGALQRNLAHRKLDLQERLLKAKGASSDSDLADLRRAAEIAGGGFLGAPLDAPPDADDAVPDAADPDVNPEAFIPGLGGIDPHMLGAGPGLGLGVPGGILANYTGPTSLVPPSMLEPASSAEPGTQGQDPAKMPAATNSRLSAMREVNPGLAVQFEQEYRRIQSFRTRIPTMSRVELEALSTAQKNYEAQLADWYEGEEYRDYQEALMRSDIEAWQAQLTGTATPGLTKIRGPELRALHRSQKERYDNKQYIGMVADTTRQVVTEKLQDFWSKNSDITLGQALGDDKHLFTDLQRGPGPEVNTPGEADLWQKDILQRVAYVTLDKDQKDLIQTARLEAQMGERIRNEMQTQQRLAEERKALAKNYGGDLGKALDAHPSQWRFAEDARDRADRQTAFRFWEMAVLSTSTPEGREKLGVSDDYTRFKDIDKAIPALKKALPPQKVRELLRASKKTQEEVRAERRRRNMEKRGSDTPTTLRAGK